jgi:hypothetical protein
MIKLRHLRYFVTVVDAGSFSRAATIIHITQPAARQLVDLPQNGRRFAIKHLAGRPMAKYLGLHRLAVGAAIVAGVAIMSVTLPTELSSIWITGGLATFMGTLALASCPTLLANAVSAERQGRVMGNNQALQVGAESLSAVIGDALAGMFIPLLLIAFGLLLIAAGFIARIDASIAFRCSRKSIKLRAEPTNR